MDKVTMLVACEYCAASIGYKVSGQAEVVDPEAWCEVIATCSECGEEFRFAVRRGEETGLYLEGLEKQRVIDLLPPSSPL